MNEHPEQPPFDKHRVYYVVLKVLVLGGAGFLALRYLGYV